MHCKVIAAQMRIERQPIMSGCFHAEYNGLIETAYHVHEFVVSSLRIGKPNGLANDAAILRNDRRFMIALGNVNTDEQHRKHLG